MTDDLKPGRPWTLVRCDPHARETERMIRLSHHTRGGQISGLPTTVEEAVVMKVMES